MQMEKYYWFVGVKPTKEVYIVINTECVWKVREIMAKVLNVHINDVMNMLSVTLIRNAEKISWDYSPNRFLKWDQKEIIDGSQHEK